MQKPRKIRKDVEPVSELSDIGMMALFISPYLFIRVYKNSLNTVREQTVLPIEPLEPYVLGKYYNMKKNVLNRFQPYSEMAPIPDSPSRNRSDR